MIILTAPQANQVRGTSASGMAALEPRELVDGTFALPEAVLLDLAHIAHRTFLLSLPVRSVSANEWIEA